MKFTTVLVPLFATALTVATASQAPLEDDDELKVPGENPLKYCGDPEDYILSIEDVKLTPNPPKAGEKLTINAKGTLSKPIKRGTEAHIQVKWGLIKILTRDVSICDEAENVDLECPVDGDVEIEKSVNLPVEIPPGKYNVVANVTTKDDDLVTCLEASVPFNLPGSMFGDEL